MLQATTSAFYVDWEGGGFGYALRDGSFDCKSDFAIRLTMLIEAEEKTGYMCYVKRAIDGQERYYVYISHQLYRGSCEFNYVLLAVMQ